MQLEFLCDGQRAALRASPGAAAALWEATLCRLDQGTGPTPLQVALAGTALECAFIALEQEARVNAARLQQFASTVEALTRPLVQLRKLSAAVTVIALACVLLRRLTGLGADPRAVENLQSRLMTEGRRWAEEWRAVAEAAVAPMAVPEAVMIPAAPQLQPVNEWLRACP